MKKILITTTGVLIYFKFDVIFLKWENRYIFIRSDSVCIYCVSEILDSFLSSFSPSAYMFVWYPCVIILPITPGGLKNNHFWLFLSLPLLFVPLQNNVLVHRKIEVLCFAEPAKLFVVLRGSTSSITWKTLSPHLASRGLPSPTSAVTRWVLSAMSSFPRRSPGSLLCCQAPERFRLLKLNGWLNCYNCYLNCKCVEKPSFFGFYKVTDLRDFNINFTWNSLKKVLLWKTNWIQFSFVSMDLFIIIIIIII